MLKRKPVAVEALAQRLSDSEAEREAAIAAAHERHESTRSDVIEQGRQRAAELRRLEAEAAAEAQKAEALVSKAVSR